jgi:hypothetical protein
LARKTSTHATTEVFNGVDVDGVGATTQGCDLCGITSGTRVHDTHRDRARDSGCGLSEGGCGGQSSQSSYIANGFVE